MIGTFFASQAFNIDSKEAKMVLSGFAKNTSMSFESNDCVTNNTSADAFTAGVKTYKFRVDQAEGSFVGQAQPTATTDDAAKTVSYSIKSSSTAVTNADVLKSIVALIASINKQIQALQKLILKR
jgi:hypothetical protein